MTITSPSSDVEKMAKRDDMKVLPDGIAEKLMEEITDILRDLWIVGEEVAQNRGLCEARGSFEKGNRTC